MNELSVFIDESGDFGAYDDQCPSYIITMVFHDQNIDLSEHIRTLDRELSYMELTDISIHTGPIIRKEETYKYMPISTRRRIFNKLVAFFRKADIKYRCLSVRKRKQDDVIQLTSQLSRLMSEFLRERLDEFLSFDAVKVYYDNGQIEVSRILASVFSALIPNSQFRKTTFRVFYKI